MGYYSAFKGRVMSKKSSAEQKLLYQMQTMELPTPESEFKFSNDRKWRFDFAWYDVMLAVEVEGGVFNQGRHTRPKGFENDCVKYNEAAIMGWTVLRYPITLINSGFAVKQIEEAYDRLYLVMNG